MNPGDFILLLLPLAFAALNLLAHGWTVNGVGPALLATAGGVWHLWMQWLRHRSYLRHRDSDFIPGTQHLAISGWLGWSLAIEGPATVTADWFEPGGLLERSVTV